MATQGRRGLMPFTRLVLVVSAVVQLVFGIGNLLTDAVWNEYLWTEPLPPWPEEAARFAGLNYLAGAVAALYAVKLDRWTGAKVYLAYSFPYIVMSVIAALWTAADPGVPPIMWAYVALSAIYLPVVAYAWRKEQAAAAAD